MDAKGMKFSTKKTKIDIKKNLLASLARMSVPKARDLMVVALRAQCCALHGT